MLTPDMLEKLWSAAREERKDEINRFWQRFLFFWGFVALLTGANLSLQYNADAHQHYWIRATLLAFSSLISFIMYLSSRASKKWQETWEKRVEVLEAQMFAGVQMYGASHATKSAGHEGSNVIQREILGSGDWSVSKAAILIALMIFLFYSLLLLLLLFSQRGFSPSGVIDCGRISFGFAFVILILLVPILIRSEGADKEGRPPFDLTTVD